MRAGWLLSAVFILSTELVISQVANPTADQIIQRSINNAGGSTKLDSVPGVETISKLIIQKKDTISVAVKRFNKSYYFVSVLGKASSNATTLYNKGHAILMQGDTATPVTDPARLEEWQLQTYLCRDYGYRKLGYRFEKMDDQHFTNTDLYQVKVISPLGKSTLNHYEKRTGNLTMIVYPNGNRTIITDYHKADGLSYPSEVITVDTLNNITRSVLTDIRFDVATDTNWFRLPPAGTAAMPASLKTGKFVYVGANAGSTIERDSEKQVESNSESNIEYKVRWEGANNYLLYDLKDPASLPVTANIKDIKVKITSWNERVYYCHYVTSAGDGGTCVFEQQR